jgi:hypothetical protein
MSESQEDSGSSPLAGRVTIHRSPDYRGVHFVFGNRTERPIGVAYSQPIPDSTAPDQFRFQSEQQGDSWTLSETDLSLEVEVGGQSTVETGYALTDTDVSTVWNAINQGIVTVSDADGEVVGRVGGLEPNVVDAEEDDNSSQSQRVTAEPAGQETPAESTSNGEDDPAPVEDVDSTEVAELAAELDAETPQSERGAAAGEDADSVDTATSGDGARTGAGEADERADLPATRADYILSEVHGEIQSAAEFEWRTLRERSKPRQFVDKVRSWLGF